MLLRRLLIGITLVEHSFASDIVTYLSAPGQQTVQLHVLTSNQTHKQAPGLLFLTPYQYGGQFYAPTIYKPSGDLLWSGEYTAEYDANNFHTVQYKNQSGNYFLYHDGLGTTFQTGVVRIFNGSYDQVSPNYGARNGLSKPDDHEGNVPTSSGGDSLIYDIYQLRKANLTAYAGPANGWIIAGCFQEISLITNKLLFQWCSNDWVPFYETYVFLPGSGNYSNSNSGQGTKASPWDYFHINAIDQDSDGNYLVSSRHTCTLYKVAGRKHDNPGSIIWKLGGKYNTFTMEPKSFNFSFQHDGRWQSPPSTKSTLVSLFDNGSDGNGLQSAPASSGMIASVDEVNKVATLKHQYIQPLYLSIGSQGSVQVLSNGNAFICWGQLPYVSEFAQDGELLYDAKFGSLNPYLPTLSSYRGYKNEWIGTPSMLPRVFAYSQECNSSTKYAYANWNGATELAYWKLRTGNSETGPWSLHNEQYMHNTYETAMAYNSTEFQEYIQALAYDEDDNLLATSNATSIFVPLSQYNMTCGPKSCGLSFTYSASSNGAENCKM